ncbi:MAG: exo-alpha-sialidase [Clostridia bacterium]|nr:exo-alpha-sialidase [Clostridia bacterium]
MNMLKKCVLLLLVMVMGAQLFSCGKTDAGKETTIGQTKEPEEQSRYCVVTYLDVDGVTVLGSEQVVRGELAKGGQYGEERRDYVKMWIDQNGNEFDASQAINEDLSLRLYYQPEGAKQIYSKEVLDMIKTPAKVNFDPEDRYYQNYIYFAMQASIEMTQKGRLWSCWIGGEDGSGAYLIATYSDDEGETWEDIQFVIDPHDDSLPLIMNTHIGCFWQDPLGRLWLFYQQSFGMWDGEGANFAIICENPDAKSPKWSEPRYISFGASLKKPIVTSDGEWLLPVSLWERWHMSAPLEDVHHELDDLRGALVFASVDQGETWEYRGGVTFEDSSFNEHSIVELDDGRIMMIARCKTEIRKAYSSDGGRTWSMQETAFPHVNSLAMIRTLPSGNILLVKHGQSMTSATASRTHLTAFISTDNGETWQGGLLLDERKGVSYPDIAIAADGTIFVQYDRNRKTDAEILFARFTEADVLAGKIKTSGSALKQIIKDIRGIKGNPVSFGRTQAFEGKGTEAEPYLIGSVAEWNYLALQVSLGVTYKGMYFEQTKDIDFGGANIQPVGYSLQGDSHVRAFCGNYNGNGYKISNFEQIAPELYTRGLFGYMTAGSVSNVTVENATIRCRTNAGAIVGYAQGSQNSPIQITNCKTGKNVSIICYEQGGGLVGRGVSYVEIIGCENNASVYAPYASAGKTINIGGIAGFIDDHITIRECVNNGTVHVRHSSLAYLGGITSNGKNSIIADCVNRGELIAECCVGNVHVGGISGWNSSVTMERCVNTGTLRVDSCSGIIMGGIIGFYGKDDSTGNRLIDVCNLGALYVKAYDQSAEILVGGVVGRASCKSDSKMRNCISLGAIQKQSKYGAIISSGSLIGGCYSTVMEFDQNVTAVKGAVGYQKIEQGDAFYCATDEELAQGAWEDLQDRLKIMP